MSEDIGLHVTRHRICATGHEACVTGHRICVTRHVILCYSTVHVTGYCLSVIEIKVLAVRIYIDSMKFMLN